MQKKIGAGADFSEDGKYRYRLWRIWDSEKPLAMCIGLNPSKANVKRNDNTIDILIRVLGQLGYGGFYMMNLFALISMQNNSQLNPKTRRRDNDKGGQAKDI